MPKINLLPKNVAELIAAGEVVERPASVIKELVENSIDAGATIITVEIKRGGITYIRVTDNGCGIAFEDVPTAFLRHATSKIKVDNDLNSIATLGFRGEALAAVSSVAKVEMLTFDGQSDFGTRYLIEGGQETLYEESGCPKGTTIVIRDIFYNTPARMKFLKKDISEANACAAVIDRIALSHPEISFKFIRDGKQTLSTTGEGSIKSAVYSVLGREFTGGLIEVEGKTSAVSVTGLTCKPVFCRPTRNSQFTFLNGRLVRSGTVVAAVEQAYKNSSMVGKFPSFVLYLTVPFETVDVNVHPAKTEVRFSDERSIFDAVYSAVKNALSAGDTRPEVKLSTPAFNRFEHTSTAEYRQQPIYTKKTIAEEVYSKKPKSAYNSVQAFRNSEKPSFVDKVTYFAPDGSETKPMAVKPQLEAEAVKHQNVETVSEVRETVPPVIEKRHLPSVDIVYEEEKPEITFIGEAFSTYIIVQMNDSIFMIDKHAAHERIIFNRLQKEQKTEVQVLLSPVAVSLTKEEYAAVTDNTSLLAASGFEIEDFGNSSVLVRTVPAYLTGEDISSLISEAAQSLITAGAVTNERADRLFHTVACKAAIKAGSKTSATEMLSLAEKVLSSKEIMYCPHGRPVAFEIKKRELEKQFGRIQ